MKKRIRSIVLSLALVCTLLPQAFLPARAVTKQDVCMDDYAEPLGTNYTVHFSVPAGVTKPADTVSNTDTGITLPTVEGPEGYTFLGWVVSDYDNVETRPANT